MAQEQSFHLQNNQTMSSRSQWEKMPRGNWGERRSFPFSSLLCAYSYTIWSNKVCSEKFFSQPNLKWWSQSCHVLAMLTNDFCLRLWDSEEQANSFREPPDRPSTCGGRLLTGFQFQRKCLSLQDVVESDLSLLCGLLCKRRRYKMPIL